MRGGAVIRLAVAMLLGVMVEARAAGGDVDPTFGVGGFVEHAIQPTGVEFAHDGAGRIVMAANRPDVFEVRRFMPDGSLDASFGVGGIASATTSAPNAYPALVLVDGAGGIIVRGIRAMARFDDHGVPVATFGSGGVVEGLLQDASDGLYLPDDGVVILRSDCYPAAFECVFTLDRHRADGSFDPGFGTGGHTTPVAIPFGIGGLSIGLQSDGGLIVAAGPQLVRFLADGTRDLTFGVASGATALPDGVGDLVVLPDDRIVVALRAHAVARFTAAGIPDATFGTGGLSRVASVRDETGGARRLLVADDGTATVVYAPAYSGYDPRLASHVARFTAAGEVDPTFAPCGFTVPAGIVVDDAALLPDGQVLLMGGLEPAHLIPGDDPRPATRLRFARLGTPAPTTCLPAVSGSSRVGTKAGGVFLRAAWNVDGAVPRSAFGDPLGATGFALCLLPAAGAPGDVNASVAFPGGRLCRGKPCWTASPTAYRLKVPRWRIGLRLNAGPTGRARILLKALPWGIAASATPVTLRLDRVDGPECWETTVDRID